MSKKLLAVIFAFGLFIILSACQDRLPPDSPPGHTSIPNPTWTSEVGRPTVPSIEPSRVAVFKPSETPRSEKVEPADAPLVVEASAIPAGETLPVQDEDEHIAPTKTLTSSPTPTLTLAATKVIIPTSVGCAATDESLETILLGLINSERSAMGYAPLNWNAGAAAAARRHSADMACNGWWYEHNGTDGSTVEDRLTDAGVSFSHAAQNILIGDDPYIVFDNWMRMPSSRAQMLNPDFSEAGIGYANNPESDYKGYFTAVFTRP